jgi:hypothetical protein
MTQLENEAILEKLLETILAAFRVGHRRFVW